MRVSTQFPIAVHALMMVAYFPDTRITSELAAKSAGCNSVIIRNIFLKLKKAGLLSVRPGRSKMELAKPVGEISLWDIYAAVETDETDEIFKFHPHTSCTCPVGSNIRSLLHSHFDDAIAAMREELSKVTLEDLTKELKSYSKK
ncbi:Rrf2 family transcriptional regulator [Anaerocolumna xylanovorans]|uniref:Transcriptional regulator, BadM/Rrf2 family n=1 Tax=Anaerocolumna xylanovorans DSM 12503 TaxID=1121345 RepID=A0A1M7XWE9_9FIRM|nr:Rrf2 family transcriptional regulator [Anaerocolumna xylanovorans]SHO43078.1 transcriptional regulator, BadM/Rrf2 family [Anaerocolumna xylanovorans DSM 12503]